jgi:hypothetical protein
MLARLAAVLAATFVVSAPDPADAQRACGVERCR